MAYFSDQKQKLNPGSKGNQCCCISSFGPPPIRVCSTIWNPQQQTEIDKIVKVQSTAARWRNQSHVGEMLAELQWPELQERKQQASLTFFYKIHNNLVTIDKNRYLSEAGNRSTRSHPFQYDRPNAYTDGLKFSFFPRTTATCNGLTTEAVSAETVDGFKSKI